MPSTIPKLGFYYSPDDRHYRRSDLSLILPALRSVNAGWLTLKASIQRAVPEEFIEALLGDSIRPIIHMPAAVGDLAPNDLRSLMTAYAQWGIDHVIVFDRPNLKRNWAEGDWRRGNLVERFADHIIPILEMQADIGLSPVLPPFQPGGDYWDLAFLKALLRVLNKRLSSKVKDRMKIAAYAWTNGKPLDWGAGGPDAWPEARPYHTPHGAQDHRGFRLFEWYSAMAESIFNRTLPILVIAGGACNQDEEKSLHSGPRLEINLAIARMILENKLPDYLEAFSFYNLYDPCATHGPQGSWLGIQDQQSQALHALQQALQNDMQRKSNSHDKHYAHYVLLPSTSQHQSMLAWAEVGPYAIQHQPVVGFSTVEAKQAHRVTLIGTEAVFPTSTVEELESSGCVVRRLEQMSVPSNQETAKFVTTNGVSQE